MSMKALRYQFLLCALLTQMMFFGIGPRMAIAEELPSSSGPYLIISAVQITGGTGHTQEDFVELYNPTTQPFDLNGYRLVKRTVTATTDTTIQSWAQSTIVLPHHFFLWANSNYTAVPVLPDATSSGTLADNNGIALRHGANDSGEIIQSLAWGSTVNGFESVSVTNPAANQSLILNNLFDVQAGFLVQPSNPRNSSVELLPEPNDVPEDPPPPVEAELPPVEETPPPPAEDQPSAPEVVPPSLIDIKITELLPNPAGSDSGFEQIELYNAGSETASLAGLKLDDIAPADPLSSNAYILPAIEVASQSYFVVTIPAGKFALNNTSGEVVTLLSAIGESLDTVFYSESAPEGQSYSYFVSGWQWVTPTLGEGNGQPPVVASQEDQSAEQDTATTIDNTNYDNSGLEISELYPDPSADSSEFVEIYNSGEETAQLSQVSLWVGVRHKLLPEQELLPGEYYVVYQKDLLLQLRNSGQTVKLMEDTTILSSVTYPTAIDSSSYARFEDGWLWTTQVTEGKDNVLKLPDIVKKAVTMAAEKTVQPVKPKTTIAKTTPAKSAPKAKSASITANTTASAKPPPDGLSIDNNQTPEAKQKESLGKIIAMGAATVVAGVVALYKLVFAGE